MMKFDTLDPQQRWQVKVRLDWCLFLGLFAIMMDRYTLNPAHETLGIVALASFGMHVYLNSGWCTGVVKEFTGKSVRRRKSGIGRKSMIVMNALLAVLFVAATVSGIMVSQSLFAWATPEAWRMELEYRTAHVALSTWMWVVAAVHAGIHWKVFFPSLTMNKIRRWTAAGLGLVFVAMLPSVFIRREFDLLLSFQSAYIPVEPGEFALWMPVDTVLVFFGIAAVASMVQAGFAMVKDGWSKTKSTPTIVPTRS